jgi:hypothetical protein
MLGAILLTVHNLHFLLDRPRVRVGDRGEPYGEFLSRWLSS